MLLLLNFSLYLFPNSKAKFLLFAYSCSSFLMCSSIDFGSGAQIKSRGRNSFAVSLSEHVTGNAPQIIDSIMGKPIPSAFEGRRTNCDEV